jgi:hypothetical protein
VERIIFTPLKLRIISTEKTNMNSLQMLFYKDGFSFCTKSADGKFSKVSEFKVSHVSKWETEVMREVEVDLRLRRSFNAVQVGMVSSFFNLVPNSYLSVNAESLLNFSESEFEHNILLESSTKYDGSFLFGSSQLLVNKLMELYKNVQIFHSGTVFLNSIPTTNDATVHLNLVHHNLEIAIVKNGQILYYNLFETQTGEDILFYTLFAMEQIGMDTNKVELKTYGQLLANTKVFQILKKYVRKLSVGMKDEEFLENFTLFNLSKCELSPVPSEERK